MFARGLNEVNRAFTDFKARAWCRKSIHTALKALHRLFFTALQLMFSDRCDS